MDTILKYIIFGCGCAVAYFNPIMLTVHVVAILFIADLITGILASFKEGENLRSSKARWSFAKLCVYLFAMVLTFAICERMDIDKDTTINIVKVIVWMIIYVESLSVVENLLRIVPNNKVLKFLHYLLSVEFLKYFPLIADFFKEDKDKLNNKPNE